MRAIMTNFTYKLTRRDKCDVLFQLFKVKNIKQNINKLLPMRCTVRFRFFSFSSFFYSPFLYLRNISSGNSSIKNATSVSFHLYDTEVAKKFYIFWNFLKIFQTPFFKYNRRVLAFSIGEFLEIQSERFGFFSRRVFL